MSALPIPTIFQSFLNQEVEVTQSAGTIFVRGKEIPLYSVAPTDTTIKALQEVVTQQGMKLEVCLPSTELPYDYHLDRLSVTVDQVANGRWQIAKMDIG